MGAWDLVPSKYVPSGDLGTEDDLDDPTAPFMTGMDGSEEEPVPAAVIAEAVLPGDIRKRLQLMQTDVAERMGVSQQTVARIEKEHHVPERLAAYLRAMGYRLEMFAVRDGERIRLR